jgi:hypothetical protein
MERASGRKEGRRERGGGGGLVGSLVDSDVYWASAIAAQFRRAPCAVSRPDRLPRDPPPIVRAFAGAEICRRGPGLTGMTPPQPEQQRERNRREGGEGGRDSEGEGEPEAGPGLRVGEGGSLTRREGEPEGEGGRVGGRGGRISDIV